MISAAECTFCALARGQVTPEVVAYRDEHSAVFPCLKQQPRNQGHMLVVPVRHVATLYDVDGELAGPLMTTLARVAAGVKAAWAAGGVVVRQNNDRDGGQDVFHLHFHVIPRFADDEFIRGKQRFPFGSIEVPLAERIEQARKLAGALAR